MFDQGGTGSGGGDAPVPSNKAIVHSEFTTGELGLVFPDDGQPTVVHLPDGTDVEVEVPAPIRPAYRRICPESVYDLGMW